MSNKELAKANETKQYIISHFKMGVEKLKNPMKAVFAFALLTGLFVYLQKTSFTLAFGWGIPAWMLGINLLTVGVAFVLLMLAMGISLRSFKIEQELQEIGFVNSLGITPYVKDVIKNKRSYDLYFVGNGVPLSVWEERLFDLEHALNCHVVFVRYVNGKKDIVLRMVPASSPFDNYNVIGSDTTPRDPSKYTLGVSADGEDVLVDLSKTPHALIAGATGSGKTILMNNLLLQSVVKRYRDEDYDSIIYIADFKGGVDYQGFWETEAKLCFDEESFNRALYKVVDILDDRKNLFRVSSVRNIQEWNKKSVKPMPAILVACDEIIEVLDKTGADAARKELIKQIEAKLSTIARQGRAFGIHLILGTQRPDSDVLNGQIKNNLQIRVAGVCDEPLSRVIGIKDAHKMIPKGSPGRFINHDGIIFHGYYFYDYMIPTIFDLAKEEGIRQLSLKNQQQQSK